MRNGGYGLDIQAFFAHFKDDSAKLDKKGKK
jgi:hypothetical protein